MDLSGMRVNSRKVFRARQFPMHVSVPSTPSTLPCVNGFWKLSGSIGFVDLLDWFSNRGDVNIIHDHDIKIETQCILTKNLIKLSNKSKNPSNIKEYYWTILRPIKMQ